LVVSPSLGQIGSGVVGDAIGNGANTFRPRTTFQKCILHRLCDRFRMTREKSYVTDGFGYYIRVVKGPDSGIPPRLLLNVQPPEYAIQSSFTAENGNNNNNSSSSCNAASLTSNFEHLGLQGLASEPNANIDPTCSGGPSTSSKSGSTKNRKMKIMKRSSSSNISSSSGDNQKSSKNTNKQRNSLSEKERKYAEARARIFQQEESTAADSAGLTTTTPDGSTGLPCSASDVASENTSMPPTLSQSGSGPQHLTSSASSSNSSITDNARILGEQTSTQARSKAVYRNRQQEEADPDFKRGVGIIVTPQPPTSPAEATMAAWSSSGTVPYYHHPQLIQVGGRGYYGQPPHHHHTLQHYAPQQFFSSMHLAGPAGTHQGEPNLVIVPGSSSGIPYAQPGFAPSPARGATIMTTGGSINATGSGVPRYANAPSHNSPATTFSTVDMMRHDHFPALR
jgi:hypothetical protein